MNGFTTGTVIKAALFFCEKVAVREQDRGNGQLRKLPGVNGNAQ